MYDIEKLKEKVYQPLMITHYSFQTCVKQKRTCHSGIWYLRTYFCHIASRREKKEHESSNDDVINFKAMTENTHSVLFYKYYGLSLKNLVFWDLSLLLMTNNYNSFQKSKICLIDCLIMMSSLCQTCSIET